MPVEILRPNADGDLSGLYVYPSDGIHWNKISEVVPDDDATYVEALYWFATGSWSDSYHLADLADSVTVSNVRVVARVRRIAQNPAGTYPTSIGLGVRIGGVNYYSNYSVSSNSYVTIARDFATNPNTGLGWTVADINALQTFLNLRKINMALWQGGYIHGRCTQLYVEITYAGPPAVMTLPATGVNKRGATLHGILTDDRGQDSDCGFEWGLTDSYSHETPWQSGRHSGDAFVQPIAGLNVDTTYHFRARARNSSGVATGADMTFRTLKETIEVPPSLVDPSLKLLLEEET